MTVYSTIWTEDASFNQHVSVADWRELGWTRSTLFLLRQAGRSDTVILNGALGWPARWRDLVTGCLLRLKRRSPGLVVADATWHPRSDPDESSAGWLWFAQRDVQKVLLRLVTGRRSTICFLSRSEVTSFVEETGVDRRRAAFTPFFVTIPAEMRAELDQVRSTFRDRQPYIFTGGNSLRDWGLLCDALGGCGAKVRVATAHTARSWPANFEVGPVPTAEFFRLAAGAAVGVLPLRGDVKRSGGQQTYLNMLALGVPVVVNDAPGVADHLTDVPGAWVTGTRDAEAMRSRIHWLLDGDNRPEVDGLVAVGRSKVIERYSEHRYLERLHRLAEISALRA